MRSSTTRLTLPATLLCLVAVTAGCRNTTTTPISPLGTASPLTPVSPMQGNPQLSPVQPTSGFGTFGAPTRVPPPPTGTNAFSASGSAPPSGYGPQSTDSFGLGQATTGGNVYAPAGTTIGSAVQQTGWVGDADPARQVGPTFGSGFGGEAPLPSNGQAPLPNSSQAPLQPTAGGMQVIDLTQAPYPPGYVPPQDRVQYNRPPTTGGIGQPINSTVPRSTGDTFINTSDRFESTGNPVPRDGNALPSTEPFPQAQTANGELQWRRPSPRF